MQGHVEAKYTELGNGFQCYYQHLIPAKPRALIVMVHGLGDHIGRYRSFLNQMTERGFACALYDQRGHGLSEGKRGHIRNFDQWVDDLYAFFRFSKRQFDPETPTFLLGGSLGGLISLYFIVEREIKVEGFIGAAVAIKPNLDFPEWKLNLVRKLGRHFPSMTVFNGLKFDNLTRDEKEIEAIKDG